jgi:hypothetical protein
VGTSPIADSRCETNRTVVSDVQLLPDTFLNSSDLKLDNLGQFSTNRGKFGEAPRCFQNSLKLLSVVEPPVGFEPMVC